MYKKTPLPRTRRLRNITGCLLALSVLASALSSCGKGSTAETSHASTSAVASSSQATAATTTLNATESLPLPTSSTVTYPAAKPLDDLFRTFYEVFVYSYADGNGDEIGDFAGLTAKLDYINDGDPASMNDLGANGIWLMPIMPSPTYHKYDVLDYKAIDPQYGSMADFDAFIAAAHVRGINVIIDLVLNHTALDHPWFIAAVDALAKGDFNNPYVSYYNFSQEKKDNTWYQTAAAGWYYEGKFWSGMPDLNLASEALRTEFENIMEFWLVDRKVDGFRLDAVKEFYSGDDPQNIEVLSWVNETAKAIQPDAYLVGEAWSGFQVYKQYYRSGIDSFFDFAFADYSGLTVRSINLENGRDYAVNLTNAQKAILEIAPGAINAPFLSNHDTGRLAGFLASDPGKLRLAAAANLFTSGSSFVYYGEELGMRGAGRDENKRAPLPWGPAGTNGLTSGPPDMEADGYSYPFGTIAEQLEDPASLLSYYREAIRIRTLYPEIARGLTALAPGFDLKAHCAVAKTWTDDEARAQRVLLVLNFSSEANSQVLPSEYSGWELVASLPSPDGERVTMDQASLNFPPFSVAVLKPSA